MDDPGPGRRLGVDVGTVRIGVASSDRDAKLAMPVETVKRVTGFKAVSYTHLTLPTKA